MKLVHANSWTPEHANYCVLSPQRWGTPKYVKYGLTHTGIGPVFSGEPEWLSLQEAKVLAKAAGEGFGLGEKYDVYRATQRHIAASAETVAVELTPEAAVDYW